MFIQTQSTPNPNSLKFLPAMVINDQEGMSFVKNNSSRSPLATLLLGVEWVKEVYIGHDFITISKEDSGQWELMKPEILVLIMDYLVAGGEVITKDATALADDSLDSEIITQIKEIIEHRVRPAVAQDGGDIIFRGFVDGIVQLELRGACSGCPSSSVTLKHGIENMLKHYVPEILAVEEVQPL